MLLQIREFMAREQTASITQLARYFQIDEQALQPMLDIWIRKKIIIISGQSKNCHNPCYKCPTNAQRRYQYCL